MPSSITQKLASSFSFFASRYAPAFITLLVLSGGFYFYFSVIVSKNEAALKERSFRGLHRMATNITGKVDDYVEKNVGNFLAMLSKFKTDSASRAQLKANYDLQDAIIKDKLDTALFSVKFLNGWQLRFRGANDSVAYASVQKFTASLLRRDLFPYYLLAEDDNVLLDEINISHKKLSDFLPGNYARDSVKRGQIQSGEIREVNIRGKEYKLFLLPFITEGKNKFTIGGYMPLESYVSEQRYIPPYALLWMFIGLMVVVLMFPLLKVFLMHRSEQLLVSNAITSLASLHVIAAIIVLAAINSYVYFNIVLSKADSSLKAIATDTQLNFTSEVDAALSEIDSIQSVVNKTGFRTNPVIVLPNLRDANKEIADTTMTNKNGLGEYRIGSRYPYFKHIAWADTLGKQKYRWTTNSRISQKTDVSDRDYFKAVKSGDLWLRNSKPYYLTGVSSWLSNEKLAVISTPFIRDSAHADTTGLVMVSLSGRFRSMFNALLPEGYGFCIVKENGDVLFHQDENRSLNENLLEECTDNESLQSLLRTKSSGFTASTYSGSSKRFYVKPIPGMPYSVVTFRDMRTIWSEDLDVISACSILCLMNLAVILLAVLIIQASGYKQSLLQGQTLLFTWLRPNKKLKNAYGSVSVFYWFSMILQSLFFIFYDGKDQLCLVGISFSYSYILLSYAYFRYAVFNEGNESKKQQNRKPVYILAAFYAFIILVFTINLESGQFMFLLSQLLVLGIAWLFTRDEFSRNTLLEQKGFRWWYVLSVFSFMAATSITPLLNFYFLSFKEERLLSLKRSQLEFAKLLMQEQGDTLSRKSDTIRFSYSSPFYYRDFEDKISALPKVLPPNDTAQNGFEFLYRKIMPSFSERSRELEYLVKKKDTTLRDIRWHYVADSGLLQLIYTLPKTKTWFDGGGLLISGTLQYDIPDTERRIKDDLLSFLLLIGMLLLFLWGFNFLLHSLIQRIFFQGYDNSSHFSDSDLPFITSLPDDENVFVNGTVNSGKNRMLKEYLSLKKVWVYIIDLAVLSSDKPDDLIIEMRNRELHEKPADCKTVVLIRHFELFMNDLTMTEKKLRLFESLLHLKKQVIVLSSRSYDSMVIINSNAGPGATDYTDRWSNVMNQFYNLYHRWTQSATDTAAALKKETEEELLQAGKERLHKIFKEKKKEITETEYSNNTGIIQNSKAGGTITSAIDEGSIESYFALQLSLFFIKLDKECRHSDFLWSLRPTLLNYIKKHKKEFVNFDFQNRKPTHVKKVMARYYTLLHEQICLKIQSLSSSYYLAVWQSLSRDEQRTLYDIAQDDMVNPNNRDIASRLADLGLVKRVPDIACYEVMNASFRNFIFTQLDKQEVKSLQADADGKGSWNSFQLPVLIVVIAIGIFLFTTQKDAFTNMITYLGAAAGGIAALLKVLGMIPSSKS